MLWFFPSVNNLAYNKPVKVSTTSSASYPNSAAVDKNTITRWSSAYSDAEWIYVDLGATYNITKVNVAWEAVLGKNYTIQTSNNTTSWTTIKTVTNNASQVNMYTSLSGIGRFTRINCTARGTTYGYSIQELEVYGSAAAVL
jgi:hypothetical protein